ncbi:unnamed protein product [Rhodiola kirilowii]
MHPELVDDSSPKGVLDASTGGALESGNGEVRTPHRVTRRLNSGSISHWRKFFSLWKKKSFKRFPSFAPIHMPHLSRRKTSCEREETESVPNQIADDKSYQFKKAWMNFTLKELESVTDNFSPENVIGQGGYAIVYKGCLPDGQLIAVKRLTKGTVEEQSAGFLSELGVIAHVDHPNTAKLVGCGVEGGMYLVFELSPHGSLGSILHGSTEKLDWGTRYKIALGIAEGLLYLHESCQRRIIHRDIKADNILLTEEFEPQICDFGLAKWLPEDLTHHNVSKFEGTFGYFAPEYFLHGIVDEKTDIYAFGVLLLELITGRRALDDSHNSLVLWAKPLLNRNSISELVDPSLGGSYVQEEMDRVALTASLCIEQSSILRPRMNQIVVLLRSNEKKHQARARQRTYSEELMDADEYNMTRYLSNMKRFREIALS